MKAHLNPMFVFATLAFAGSGLHASSFSCNPCNIGTGQAPGTANTASDPVWTIGSAPSGNTSGPAVIIGSPIWGLVLPAGLNWIATIPGTGSGGPSYNGGDYIYEVTFDAPAGGAALSGFSVAADNAVNVFLNASASTLATYASTPCTTGTLGCLTTWGDFSNINTSGFSAFSSPTISTSIPTGWNTIYLEVENGADSYTGVVAQGSLTAQGSIIVGVPEPTTWAMLGGGIGLVGLLRRRRRDTL